MTAPAPHPEDSALIDYDAGGLPKATRAEIAAHLKSCERCKKFMVGLNGDTSPRARPLVTGSGLEPSGANDPLVGQLIGEYRVLQRLGRGGMGILYRAEQPLIGKPVAIKVLLDSIAADPVLVQRMIEEARAVNAIRHPNIVDIFSFGQLPDGRPYMVMELLEGQSLLEMLNEVGRLTPAQTMVVLSQSMAALEVAHAAGVIHRDLKPDNIWVDLSPDTWKVTLFDFGLAKRQGAPGQGLTSPGMVVGTPGYMAPEQVRGDKDISAKTDIYAMGVVAWTLMVGREPFAGGSIVEIMHRHIKVPAPPLRKEVPEVPPQLEAVVMRMLQKQPDRRPTASEVRAIVTELLKGAGPLPATKKAAGRARTGLALATIGTLGFGLVLAGWWVNSEGAQPAPPPGIGALRPIAPPLPVVVPPPIVVAPPVLVPAPEPPVAVPETASTQRSWRCSKVTQVGEVHEVIGGSWKVFLVSVEDEPQVMITSANTKKGAKQIRSMRKLIVDCRKTQRVIAATHSNPSHEGLWTTQGKFRGVEVDVGNLSVGKAVPSR